jgi:anthranilate phosphoribosyltransferase
LDEITVSDKTRVAEVTADYTKFFEISPEQLGFERVKTAELEKIRGGKPEDNAKIIQEVLQGKRKDAARSLVLINAAAALLVGGKAEDLQSAIKLADKSLDNGDAFEKLDKLIELTNEKQ